MNHSLLHVDRQDALYSVALYSVIVSLAIVTTGAGTMIALYSLMVSLISLTLVTTGVAGAIFAMVAMVAVFFPFPT